MNQDRAREYFSAYYEDALEPAMRVALEQKLASDRALRGEYAAFEEAMNDLASLKFEEIETPAYLSDRIASRLEEARAFDPKPTLFILPWVRNLAFGGLAAAAVVGAFLQIGAPGEFSAAGVLPAPKDQPMFSSEQNVLYLNYQPSREGRVLVMVDGKPVGQVELEGRPMKSPLENPNPQSVTFEVFVEGQGRVSRVAVPGRLYREARSGEGTLSEFVRAVADVYRVPVQLDVDDAHLVIRWDLEGTDALAAVSQVLSGARYSVDQRSSGLISILDR
jgi:hypothetical protein